MDSFYNGDQRALQEHIHTSKMAEYQRVRSSRYVPRARCVTPFAEWKRIDVVQEVLPPRDGGNTAKAGGTITVEEYQAKLAAGAA